MTSFKQTVVPTLIVAGFVMILPLVIAFVGLWWATGCKFNITRSGKTIGHVRWFTYYPKESQNGN